MIAFADAALYAGQEKQYPNEASAQEGSAQSVQQIEAIIAKLNQPEQLVELIIKCNAKTAQIPSSSKYQPYYNYFMFVQEFAISKLACCPLACFPNLDLDLIAYLRNLL